MSNTTEELDSIADEPDTAPPLTVDEQRARRLSVASPLDRAIQSRPFGNPQTGRYVHALRFDELRAPAPGLDPGYITEADGYYSDETDASGNRIVKYPLATQAAQAAQALEAMRGVVTRIIDAREKSKLNPALASEAQQVLAVADLYDKVWEPASRQGDAARKSIEARIDAIEKEMRTGIQTDNSHQTPQASEIRAFVRGMKTTDRSKFIAELIDKGDTESLAAILKGKPYLSGLTDDMVAVYVEQFNHKAKPHLPAELTYLRTVLEKLEIGHRLFVNEQIERAMGVKHAAIRDLRARVKAASF